MIIDDLPPLAEAHILLVDDEPANIALYAELLEREQVQVSVALSGAEAISVASASQFDAILLDVVMPGMGGIETCKKLRALPNQENVPIIFVTGQGGDIGTAFAAGGSDYLTKPVRREELIARLGLHVQNARLRKQHAKQSLFLQTILDSLAEGVVVADQNGRFVWTNSVARSLSGINVVGADTHAMVENSGIFMPDRKSPFPHDELPIFKALRGDPSEVVELFTRNAHRPEGVDLSVRATPLPNTKDEISGPWGMVTFADISEQKAKQRELDEQRQLFADVVEHVPVMLFMKDAKELRYRFVNKAIETVTGFPREALLNKSDFDILPEDQARFFTDTDRHVLETSSAVEVAMEPLQTAHRGVRWVHTRKVTLRGADGAPRYLLGASEDITDALEARRRIESLYSALEAALDGVAIVGSDLRYEWANDAYANIVGGGLALAGSELIAHIAPEHHDALRAARTEMLATGKASLELVMRNHNGRDVWMSCALIRHRDAVVDDLSTFYFLVRDISQQRELELHKAEFITLVTHELRSPLTAIMGGLELLDKGYLGEVSANAKSAVYAAANSARNMLRIVNDLLNIQRIELGELELNKQNIDLAGFLEQLVAGNQPFAETFHVILSLVQPAPGIAIVTDPGRLSQVLTNLISNACKFSPAGSCVEIAVQQTAEQIFISVKDSGPGIPENIQARLFTKFSRSNHRNAGTGLGLALCKSMIEQMGGAISYTSSPDGACFYVQLLRV